MQTDEEVVVERVANGWIVREWHPEPRVVTTISAYRDSTFIFETFESLTKWLDSHFTKPEA